MSSVFLKIVILSLTASVMVFAVIILRLIFRKAPKWLFCVLWGLVAIKLVCPFTVRSALSLIPSTEPLQKEILLSDNPGIDSGITAVDEAINPIISGSLAPEPGASVNPLQIWTTVLSWVWIAGLAVMISYAFISTAILKGKLRTATPYQKGIKQSETVESPFVLGIIRPVIYLPYGIDGDDIPHVIAHETVHIKRKDHWWKPLGFILLSIYWFNPVMWVAYILLCRDIEAACDEKVIGKMDKDALRAYSAALLKCSVNRRKIAACPIAFGEVGVKSRIKRVMNYKKPAFWIILAALTAGIAASVFFLTAPREKYEISRDSFCFAKTDEGTEEINLGKSDTKYIIKLLNKGKWTNSQSNCEEDYVFYTKKQEIGYHSECGTFNDYTNQKSMKVTEAERQKINEILDVKDEDVTSAVSYNQYPPQVLITDGNSIKMPRRGTYSWSYIDVKTGSSGISTAEELPFSSAEMKETLPVFFAKPSVQDSKKGNEVTMQFSIDCPEKVTVSYFDENEWKKVPVSKDFTFELAEGTYVYKIETFLGTCRAEYGFIGDYNEYVIIPGQEADRDIEELVRQYPGIDNIPTAKGLEVYVWEDSPGKYAFSLRPGTNAIFPFPSMIDHIDGFSAGEIQSILEYYISERKLNKGAIFITAVPSPITGYKGEGLTPHDGETKEESDARYLAYVSKIRKMLLGD